MAYSRISMYTSCTQSVRTVRVWIERTEITIASRRKKKINEWKGQVAMLLLLLPLNQNNR